VRAAAADVPRIRQLWRDHYGCWKRRRGETSAEEFAAMRWSDQRIVVAEAEVARRLKPRGKKKPRAR
jgi:hypothetical protein